MASGITTAFWSMTINNYDDNDLALLHRGYPDYCREIIHTLEEGEEGTPHVQAWIKLQRQQRLSFVKKLFPRGHFKPLTSDLYILNTERYAQKSDDTTRSASVHRFNDPMNTIESVMRKVIRQMYDDYAECDDMDYARAKVEHYMVIADYKYAKIFVSSTYKQMWKQFGNEMYSCLFKQFEEELEREHTHTHTHSDEKLSREGGITDDDGESEEQSDEEEFSEGEDDEGDEDSEGSEVEGYDESSDDESS